jgi:hypothetical protein
MTTRTYSTGICNEALYRQTVKDLEIELGEPTEENQVIVQTDQGNVTTGRICRYQSGRDVVLTKETYPGTTRTNFQVDVHIRSENGLCERLGSSPNLKPRLHSRQTEPNIHFLRGSSMHPRKPHLR